jgi:hypothetical protein
LKNGVQALALTTEQKQWILRIDEKTKEILGHGGGDEALLTLLCDQKDDIEKIIDSSLENELNAYCEQYEGFYRFMKLLEQLADGIASGIFDDILK